MYCPTGGGITNDVDNLFQSDAELLKRDWQDAKFQLKLGSPIETPAKILDMVLINSTTALVAQSNFSARLLNLTTSNTTKLFMGHSGPVTCVTAYTKDSTLFVITGSWDKTARRYHSQTRETLTIYRGHVDFVNGVTTFANRLYTASADKTLKQWDVDTGVCLRTFEGHTAKVRTCVLSVDGTRLYSGASDLTIREWNTATGECMRTLVGHETSIYALVLGPSGTDLWSASEDKTARCWDLETGKVDTVLEHPDYVRAVAVSSENRYVVTGCRDERVRVWLVSTGECVGVYDGHAGEIMQLGIYKHTVWSASLDATVRSWSLQEEDLKQAVALTPEDVNVKLQALNESIGDEMTAEELAELNELMDEE
jgi:WD40 repeat protein